jgi:hypothetical protein
LPLIFRRTFFLSLLFLAASLFCASLLNVLASGVRGPSCSEVDGVPSPPRPPPSLCYISDITIHNTKMSQEVHVLYRVQLVLTLTAGLLSGAGASIASCLDGGRCCCFEEPAAVAVFGEGSTACIGREGKMLRVSACTREG